MKPLPFGTFIQEGRSTEMIKMWVNPSLNKAIEIPRHQDHLVWAMNNVKKLQLPKGSIEALDRYKKMKGNEWKMESWADTFQDFFMNGWVRVVPHIDLVKSKGDNEVLKVLELHGYKQDVNRAGKLLEKQFPGSGENVDTIYIEETFVDMDNQVVTDPLKIRRFFKGGRIQ